MGQADQVGVIILKNGFYLLAVRAVYGGLIAVGDGVGAKRPCQIIKNLQTFFFIYGSTTFILQSVFGTT